MGQDSVNIGVMEMRTRVILLALACFMAGLVILPYNSIAQPEGFELWSDGEFGISITYPETWTIDERPETINVPCIVEAPHSEFEDYDSFGAFVMPVYIGEGYFNSVSDLADVWLGTVKDDWRIFNLHGREMFETHQGFPVVRLTYSIVDEEDNNIEWLVWLVLTETNKKAWVVGYCSRESSNDNHAEASDIISNMEFTD